MSELKLNKNILYLLTILVAIEKIKIYTRDYNNSLELYRANTQKDFNATLNLLITIGEEAKKIEPKIRKMSTKTDWKKIIWLRNIISHDYRGVDRDIIWDIVTTKLDTLKENCILLLKEIKVDKKQLNKLLSSEFYAEINYLKHLQQ